MKELKKIKYWLFDLDNTLYSGDTKVFDQVDKKMSKFISEKLNVSIDEAKKIQKNYFHEYNTTLNGMIKNHDIDANEFLEFVHDVDLNFLKKDDYLKEQISKLDGKKIIFTNGSKAHASNVTSRIGIEQLFDGVVNDAWKALMAFQIQRAREWFRQSEAGVRFLAADARWPVWTSLRLYRGILSRIEQNQYDVFNRRAYVPRFRKLIDLPYSFLLSQSQ